MEEKERETPIIVPKDGEINCFINGDNTDNEVMAAICSYGWTTEFIRVGETLSKIPVDPILVEELQKRLKKLKRKAKLKQTLKAILIIGILIATVAVLYVANRGGW